MTIVARYRIAKLLLYIFAWIIICGGILAYPYVEYGSVGSAIENNRLGFLMLIGLISSIFMLIFNILFFVKVLLKRGVALYIKDELLISSAPFVGAINIKNIKNIYSPNEKLFNRIALELDSGKTKYISIRLLNEKGSDLISAISSIAKLS